LTEISNVKARCNSRTAWAPLLIGMALAAAPALLPAQVSLTTVVDLAQRNSSPVRLAQADLMKAQAVLSKTKDVLMPSAMLGSGLPANKLPWKLRPRISNWIR